MEDILKRLLKVEIAAEAQVQKSDEERKRLIQGALDDVRREEVEFDQQADQRRTPFIQTAEEGAQRRVAEMQEQASAGQRMLRERAKQNEAAAVDAAVALMLGESRP